MTGLEVRAGAALEIGPLGDKLDKLAGGLGGMRRALDALADLRAVPLSVPAGTAAPASGPAVLDLGGPAQGRWWELTAIAVVGDDDHTAIADTNVALYVTSRLSGTQLPPLSDLILPGTQGGTAVSVPANAQFSRRQVVALHPTHIVVLVYGASSGQQLRAAGRGWDRDTDELPIR